MSIEIPATRYTYRLLLSIGRWYVALIACADDEASSVRCVRIGGARGGWHYRSMFFPG